jgi:hypothetical protein
MLGLPHEVGAASKGVWFASPVAARLNKPNGIVAVAIARELAGYCWEIATRPPHPDPVPPASPPAGDPPHTQPRSHTSTHQPPAGGSPTHANPGSQPVAASEAARASPARAQQLRDSSPEHPPAPRRPRLTIGSGRATNKGLGTAPEYEHDHRREPADARTAPQAATTSTTTNQTMTINPYPLTTAPPYGRPRSRPSAPEFRILGRERQPDAGEETLGSRPFRVNSAVSSTLMLRLRERSSAGPVTCRLVWLCSKPNGVPSAYLTIDSVGSVVIRR